MPKVFKSNYISLKVPLIYNKAAKNFANKKDFCLTYLRFAGMVRFLSTVEC